MQRRRWPLEIDNIQALLVLEFKSKITLFILNKFVFVVKLTFQRNITQRHKIYLLFILKKQQNNQQLKKYFLNFSCEYNCFVVSIKIISANFII